MRRQENQPAGCLSVPLFNQKKRNRIPLTSTPSENEFFSHSEFMANPASSHSSAGGGYKASFSTFDAPQTNQWSRQSAPQSSPAQQLGGTGSAPRSAPAARTYGLMPHPYKAANKSSVMGQPGNPARQQTIISSFTSAQNKYPAPRSNQTSQSKPAPLVRFPSMGQQSSQRPAVSRDQRSQQSRPPTSAPPVPPPRRPQAGQPRNNSWKFTSSFEPQSSSFEAKMSPTQAKSVRPTQTQSQQGTFPAKPAMENSLRILTAVIHGMRHWSKFKDRVPYLFEIFATLDSAVTLGHYGAKTFLMRDGNEVLQCVFYENELVLPRLIRGQVHRCVGNYDCSKDVLVCISVRPALPSEPRNAQEAVKACDAEMRVLVKSFSEV